ncbi:hypothetical protein MNBD_NITROSPINAE02-869 [hydrothermal vent metagenome]|uniref:GGDEF domain-containing protein n=1 Tax=hydrothermal vent metagenome TaxID=652676 RepID=A0A3B1CFY3_9ZZZZ
MTMPHDKNNRAVDIARQAIPFMSDHGIPITPRNYFVWYEYFRGHMPALKATLDELINASTEFDSKLNNEIYTRFFARNLTDEQERKLTEEIKAVEEVNATAGKILEPITRELDGASKSTESYGAKLKEIAGKIKDDKDADHIRSIMITLAKETEKISNESKAITTGLKDSTQQFEDLREKLAQAKKEARIDDVTQVKNRRAFNERISEIIKDVSKKKTVACLAIVDIDKFKRINDTYGHPVGDKALAALAAQLVDFTASSDEVFRIGGEEFAIMLLDCPLEKAFERMDSIRASIASHQFTVRGIVETITISVGVAEIEKGNREEDALKQADTALYLAKESGRNKVKTNKDLKARDVT